MQAGYGALVLHLGAGYQGAGTRKVLSGPCGNIINYEAEMDVIRQAITAIGTKFDDNSERIGDVVIFTDALSVLQVIDLGGWPVKLTHTLSAISDLSLRHAVRVTLQWIPGHAGVHGNEVADFLAKRGSLEPALNEPFSFECARRTIRACETESLYMSRDELDKGRGVWEYLKRPIRADS